MQTTVMRAANSYYCIAVTRVRRNVYFQSGESILQSTAVAMRSGAWVVATRTPRFWVQIPRDQRISVRVILCRVALCRQRPCDRPNPVRGDLPKCLKRFGGAGTKFSRKTNARHDELQRLCLSRRINKYTSNYNISRHSRQWSLQLQLHCRVPMN